MTYASSTSRVEELRGRLDRLRGTYNRLEYVRPDPVEFLHRYDDVPDREVVGLVASGLAYGRVDRILKSVESVLGRLGSSPAAFARRAEEKECRALLEGFRHRFTTGDEVASLLLGAGAVLRRDGSIESCFARGLEPGDVTSVPALSRFVAELGGACGDRPKSLLPLPDRGSACKRLHLYLRWMVRRDEVDPGGWQSVRRSQLVVPLDTHMHRAGLALGLTTRRQADLKTALDITESLRALDPDDPVKYDFAITRIGIRGDIGSVEDVLGTVTAENRREGETPC